MSWRSNEAPVPFKIRFTKRVIFKDREGTVLRTFEVGDIHEATADAGCYWVSSPGGIYKDEAELVIS